MRAGIALERIKDPSLKFEGTGDISEAPRQRTRNPIELLARLGLVCRAPPAGDAHCQIGVAS